jgi:hypothetical protein
MMSIQKHKAYSTNILMKEKAPTKKNMIEERAFHGYT